MHINTDWSTYKIHIQSIQNTSTLTQAADLFREIAAVALVIHAGIANLGHMSQISNFVYLARINGTFDEDIRGLYIEVNKVLAVHGS